MSNSEQKQQSVYTGLVTYVLQHGEPLLNKCGVATTRDTSELNHALNRLDRQLDELSGKIDSIDEQSAKK